MSIPRERVVARLREQVAAGRPIVGCGAGTGLSAKMAEAGGAGMVIIYGCGLER
jgi:predicted TIM-barrel enzyme